MVFCDCRNWVYCCILFQEPCIFATRVISQCSLFISSWQTFRPCKLKKEKRVRNLMAWTPQVPRVFNIYNQGKGRYDDKLCYHLLCHLRSSKNWVVGVASRSGRTKPITKRVNVHYDWFILSLLLPSPTIWFSLDRKRRSHKRSLKKMETFWFFRLRFRRAYDSAYDSDFWFSLSHKRSYDSDSVISENQPYVCQHRASFPSVATFEWFSNILFILV